MDTQQVNGVVKDIIILMGELLKSGPLPQLISLSGLDENGETFIELKRIMLEKIAVESLDSFRQDLVRLIDIGVCQAFTGNNLTLLIQNLVYKQSEQVHS